MSNAEEQRKLKDWETYDAWLRFFRKEAKFYLTDEATETIRVAFERSTKRKCPERLEQK